MDLEVKINTDVTELNEAIEKANRLVELLKEAQQISISLFSKN